MQKKIVLALFLAVFVVVGTFAQTQFAVSAGGGALFDFSGNNGTKDTESDKENYIGLRNTSFGAFAFLDLTYAEISGYFAYGSLSMVYIEDGKSNTDIMKDTSISAMQVGFSVLGKYPVDMGNFVIFPLIGVDYNIVLSTKTKVDGKEVDNDEIPKAEDLGQFGFLAGIGGDIKLNGPLFIRLEGLFHLRLPYSGAKDPGKGAKNTLGMGPQIKVALGYKF